jgi:hypothetical protein
MADLDLDNADGAQNHDAPDQDVAQPGDPANAGLDDDEIEPTIGSPTPPPPPPPPEEEEVNEPRVMNVRCGPCIERGRYSRCNKSWPACTMCVAEGTTEYCFEGAELHARLEAARAAQYVASRSQSVRSRRTPAPPVPPPTPPPGPPAEPRRSGSPGRENRPARGSRTRSPPPRPSAPPMPTPDAPHQIQSDKVYALRLQVIQVQAALAQAERDAALAGGSGDVRPIAPTRKSPFFIHHVVPNATRAEGSPVATTRPQGHTLRVSPFAHAPRLHTPHVPTHS